MLKKSYFLTLPDTFCFLINRSEELLHSLDGSLKYYETNTEHPLHIKTLVVVNIRERSLTLVQTKDLKRNYIF